MHVAGFPLVANTHPFEVYYGRVIDFTFATAVIGGDCLDWKV